MGVRTDLASAEIRVRARVLYGVTRTRPALLVTDGISLTYACDVEIAPTDPSGLIERSRKNKKTGGQDLVLHQEDDPNSSSWHLDDDLIFNTTMHNVPISRANADLIYADINAPVRLERSETGRWQIMGFAIEQAGTYLLYPVNLEDLTIGPVGDFTSSARLLTLGELGTFDDFGNLPFGASAIFLGNVLQRIV